MHRKSLGEITSLPEGQNSVRACKQYFYLELPKGKYFLVILGQFHLSDFAYIYFKHFKHCLKLISFPISEFAFVM